MQGTDQDIDPLHDPRSLVRLIEYSFSAGRHFNIFFSFFGCWLPTPLLMTRDRARLVWARLAGIRTIVLFYAAAIYVLAVFGGKNIPVYLSYSFVLQALAL